MGRREDDEDVGTWSEDNFLKKFSWDTEYVRPLRENGGRKWIEAQQVSSFCHCLFVNIRLTGEYSIGKGRSWRPKRENSQGQNETTSSWGSVLWKLKTPSRVWAPPLLPRALRSWGSQPWWRTPPSYLSPTASEWKREAFCNQTG